MVTVNAMGDKCPVEVIKTKESIRCFDSSGDNRSSR